MSAPRSVTAVSVAGILAVFLVQFWSVKPTNFGGWDEWLDIDLAARGILGVPYQNRPLSLLFFMPDVGVWGAGLDGFKWVQSLYLAATGVLTYLIGRRLFAGYEPLAFLAGVVAAVWAPQDPLRLDVVLGRGYAGATTGVLLAVLLLVESYLARRVLGLVLACVVAAAVVRTLEAAAGLALTGPVLLVWAEGDRTARLRWAGVFSLAVLAATAFTALPVLTGTGSNYQVSALGFDPQPARVVVRLLHFAGFHLGPLFSFEPSELFRPLPAASVVAFLAAWIIVWRSAATPPDSSRSRLLACAAFGAVAALLGWSMFALSGGIGSGDRTQFLSAPGVGLLFAAFCGLLVAPLPGRARALVVGACGAWIVGLAAARTGRLQEEWDRISLWKAQNDTLVQLTELAPMTKPNTLIVVIDGVGAWPANFTFRHAIEYLYGGAAKGWVPGAYGAYLYPARFTPRGLLYEPWPVIREPWRAPVTEHRFDEMLVVSIAGDGRLRIEESWPAGLFPPLPAGGRYEPQARIVRSGPPPASRKILRRP